MKNLPNERFILAEPAISPSICNMIDFKELGDIVSPCCLVFRGGFTNSITIGFQTNISRLLSSLVLLGGCEFLNYVKEFSKFTGVEFRLEKTLEDVNVCRYYNIDDVENILSVITKHRDELKEFIDVLKDNRPKEMTCKVDKLTDLGIKKFYVSYLEYYDKDIIESFVVPIKSASLGGSFNIEYEFNTPNNYKKLLEEVSSKIDSFSLSFAVNELVEEFKKVNDNIFDPGYYPFMTHSLPMYYSFTYDLIFQKIKRLVKMDVN